MMLVFGLPSPDCMRRVFQALAHQLGDVARDDLQAARVAVLRQRVLQSVAVW